MELRIALRVGRTARAGAVDMNSGTPAVTPATSARRVSGCGVALGCCSGDEEAVARGAITRFVATLRCWAGKCWVLPLYADPVQVHARTPCMMPLVLMEQSRVFNLIRLLGRRGHVLPCCTSCAQTKQSPCNWSPRACKGNVRSSPLEPPYSRREKGPARITSSELACC